MMAEKAGPSAIDRLFAGMRNDGVPMSRTDVLQAIEEPHWEAVRTAHDWRVYIPPSLRRDWESLAVATRLRVFEVAELVALNEEPGATMVTGPDRD